MIFFIHPKISLFIGLQLSFYRFFMFIIRFLALKMHKVPRRDFRDTRLQAGTVPPLPAFHLFKLKVEILRSELKISIKYFETFSDQYGLFLLHFISPVGRSEVDGASSSSDVRGPGFDPRPLYLKKLNQVKKPSGSLKLGVWSLSCIRGDTGFRPKKDCFYCLPPQAPPPSNLKIHYALNGNCLNIVAKN